MASLALLITRSKDCVATFVADEVLTWAESGPPDPLLNIVASFGSC